MDRKIQAKISQFNKEGHLDVLIGLLSNCGSDLEDIVSVINSQADSGKLEPLVFQPLKINEKYLAFINADARVEVIDVNIVSLRALSNQIKAYFLFPLFKNAVVLPFPYLMIK